MSGYWLGAVSEDEIKPNFFREETILGHDAFIKRIAEIDERNFDNNQILVLFTGESDKGHETKKVWDPDCQLMERIVEWLKVRVEPTGWLLHVGVGTRKEWKDSQNPFKKDSRIRLTKLPTLIAWNTMKKISGVQALQIENILVMLDD